METVAEIRKRQRDLQRQIRETNMAERRANARQAREETRAALTEDELESERSMDYAFNETFNTASGNVVLLYFRGVRPVIADMIEERLSRHAAASAKPNQ